MQKVERGVASLVYYHTNMAAFGVIKAAKALDLQIPLDVGIVTFDNYPLAEYTTPPLTAIDIDTYVQGSTALRPNGALYEFPPRFFPSPDKLTLENFKYIFLQNKFYINFLNSVFVSISSVAIAAFISAALGFVLGKFEFHGRKYLFGFIIITMIIPGITLIIPQFELAVMLGLVNKLWGLIPFYVAWVIPFSTFMIKGFMENIHQEIIEAADMDGASVFTVFFRIALPLASPAIAAVSIFNFLTAWEEYPWANTVINDNNLRTLPIAIAGFFGQHQFTQWGYVFAMSVVSLIPVIIVFITFQKYFIAGLASGSIKG